MREMRKPLTTVRFQRHRSPPQYKSNQCFRIFLSVTTIHPSPRRLFLLRPCTLPQAAVKQSRSRPTSRMLGRPGPSGSFIPTSRISRGAVAQHRCGRKGVARRTGNPPCLTLQQRSATPHAPYEKQCGHSYARTMIHVHVVRAYAGCWVDTRSRRANVALPNAGRVAGRRASLAKMKHRWVVCALRQCEKSKLSVLCKAARIRRETWLGERLAIHVEIGIDVTQHPSGCIDLSTIGRT